MEVIMSVQIYSSWVSCPLLNTQKCTKILMGIPAILTPKRQCSQNGRGEGQKEHVFSVTAFGF